MQQLFLQQTQRARGHELFTEPPWEMFQGSLSFLFRSPGPWRRGHLSQETIYLSSLLVGVESDKTMLSEAVFTVVIGAKETQRVLHLFTRTANKICDKHVQLCILIFMLQI